MGVRFCYIIRLIRLVGRRMFIIWRGGFLRRASLRSRRLDLVDWFVGFLLGWREENGGRAE